jgi:hypothetical protein
MTEQCADVTENKGQVWKREGESGNVPENKGLNSIKAGILLKINGLLGN